MAINKKLIHFKTKQKFEEELANGNILDTSIVFIKDTYEIYTHGQLYHCSLPNLSEYVTDEELSELLNNYATLSAVNNKVDKVSGKGLSTNDYTSAEKNKLAGIASGAEVNVKSDWNETNTNSDAYIKNKPTIPSLTGYATQAWVQGLGYKTVDTTYSVATDSKLGLVKSGGDVVVGSDGTMQVVDDSHNHVISNIDGLLDALNARVNLNAFSNVAVSGQTPVVADTTTDTLTLVAGNNVTITTDAANDKITISAKDTTYTSLKNPHSLTVQKNGTTVATYDGSQAVTANITVPTVNDKTLTIQKNGVAVGTFTSNASADKTINITVSKSDVGLGNVDNTADADKFVKYAASAGYTTSAGKVANKLNFPSGSYDGSSEVTLTAADFGLSNALHFLGLTTTAISDNSTTTSVVINNKTVTAGAGDVVLYNNNEYVFDGSKWHELGDGSSHALKTVTITAGNGLTGGGNLSANRTLAVGAGNGITVSADAVAVKPSTGIVVDGNGVSLGESGVTAGTYGDDEATRTLTHSDVFDVPQITIDKYGRITSASTKTLTLPASGNTNYTTGIKAGASGTNSNSESTNPFIKVLDNTTYRSQIQLKGGGATTIASDANGVITISTPAESYKGTVTSVNLKSGTGITVSSSGTAITSSGERTISLNSDYQTKIANGVTAYGWGNHASAGYVKSSGVTSVTPGTGLTGTNSDTAITSTGTVNLKTAATGEIGGVKVAKDNSSYTVTTNTSNITADVTSGKYYGVEIDKNDKAFVYVPWTDTKVTQNNSAELADYRVMLSANANDTNETNTLKKSAHFTANPNTGAFYAKGYDRIDITGQTIDLNTFTLSAGSPEIMRYIEKTSGGAANITNIPVAGVPFILDVELIRWASSADYVTKQTFVSVGAKANEYVRYCSSGTWDSSWTKRVFTDTVPTWSTLSGKPTFLTGGSQTTPSSDDGGINIYTFTKSDGTTSTLTVKNGSKGSKGDPGNSVGSVVCVTANNGTTTGNASTADGGTSYYRVKDTAGNWLSGTIAVKNGTKGSSGTNGTNGTRGSQWYSGTAVTGTSTTGTIFSGSGISSALVNDWYLNTSTSNIYKCTTAGNASTAKWAYVSNIKGATGAAGSNATVTAATGDSNGQIKINGTNITVKGLAAAAYKAVDTTVSSGSTNLITSGGVYTGLTSVSINSVTAGTSTTVKPGVLNKVSGTSVPCIFNFEKADTSTVAYEYIILFETGNGNTPWVFSTASRVKWADETVFIAESVNNANSGGAMATFGANKKIQVSVLGGIAIACVVS